TAPPEPGAGASNPTVRPNCAGESHGSCSAAVDRPTLGGIVSVEQTIDGPPTDAAALPALVVRAFSALGRSERITELVEVSALVSTNSVFRVILDNGRELIAKASSYGSYVHFRQDHALIVQWIRLMGGTRFSRFLAPIVLKDHEAFTYREGWWF